MDNIRRIYILIEWLGLKGLMRNIPMFCRDQGKVIVSGVVTKGNADFKPDAVKVAHDKPIPQHEKRPPGPTGGRTGGKVLQQPRKQ